MTTRKGLGQANILRTNNNTSTGYGVAYADEVSGHRTVANLTALYALHDWQLSASGDNTGSDAIGQLWYVVDADGNGNGCYYQLKDWSKRNDAAGWSEFMSDKRKGLSTEIIYDVSARNDGAVFESLQSLLSSSNLSTLIPTSVRHGGMSIRFVQSSDNKYVQYRLIANTFSTTVTDWQGVDDEPTTGSNNLVKSGGVADSINKLKNAGYLYAGIATPTTNPGTPDCPVFYIANDKGTYTNFSDIDVTEDDVVVMYYDTAWHKKATGIASQAKLSELEGKVYEQVPIESTIKYGYVWEGVLSDIENVSFPNKVYHVTASKNVHINAIVDKPSSTPYIFFVEEFINRAVATIIKDGSIGHVDVDYLPNKDGYICIKNSAREQSVTASIGESIIANNKKEINNLNLDVRGINMNISTNISSSGHRYTLPLDYIKGKKYHVVLDSLPVDEVLFLYKKINGNDVLVDNTHYLSKIEFDITIEDGMTAFFIENQAVVDYDINIYITLNGLIQEVDSLLSAQKKLITIKKDGGDFSSFRAATEYIIQNPNPYGYIIEVYEGVYDVLADYSESEINAANFSSGFGGIDITDGVNVIGVGCRDRIVIKGELDKDMFPASARDEISTLQMKGNCSLENLTITSNYIRYSVHDDFAENVNKEHVIKNCKMVSYYDSNATSKGISYGLGTRSGMHILIDRCNISNIGGHNNTGFEKPEYVEIVNSKIGFISMIESDSGNNGTFNIVNSDLNYLKHGDYIAWKGVGQTIYPVIGNTTHQLGNTTTKQNANGIEQGNCVMWHSLDWAEPCRDFRRFMGICIGFDEDNRVIVQRYGYISDKLLGSTNKTNWTVGTYLGVGSNGYLSVVSSKTEAVAVIDAQYNDVYYVLIL